MSAGFHGRDADARAIRTHDSRITGTERQHTAETRDAHEPALASDQRAACRLSAGLNASAAMWYLITLVWIAAMAGIIYSYGRKRRRRAGERAQDMEKMLAELK